MAAPTPVSALVHSSTLVTAGVYLIIRFGFLLKYLIIQYVIIILSLLTLIIAGVCANFEFDLKKVIALSTLSQLGVIMFVIGLGEFLVGYYHILIHAIFKALLFLCAGGLIHSLRNFQDIRYIRGLGKNFDFLSIGFRGCRLALIGFPYLAGFYSKDLICEYILIGNFNFIIVRFFLLRIGLTSAYRVKVLVVINGVYKGLSFGYSLESRVITIRILILILGACINGSFIMWLVIPEENLVYLPILIKMVSMFIILVGILLGIFIQIKCVLLFSFFNRMWFLFNLSVQGGWKRKIFLREKYFLIRDFG